MGVRRNANYLYTHSLEGGTYPTIYLNKSRHLANVLSNSHNVADRTNGRAYTTVLRPSSVVVCDVMYCG